MSTKPYSYDWYKHLNNEWIENNHSYIKKVFSDIWFNVFQTLGQEYCSYLDIQYFSKNMYNKKCLLKFKRNFIINI